jgi:hypothetical protein
MLFPRPDAVAFIDAQPESIPRDLTDLDGRNGLPTQRGFHLRSPRPQFCASDTTGSSGDFGPRRELLANRWARTVGAERGTATAESSPPRCTPYLLIRQSSNFYSARSGFPLVAPFFANSLKSRDPVARPSWPEPDNIEEITNSFRRRIVVRRTTITGSSQPVRVHRSVESLLCSQ